MRPSVLNPLFASVGQFKGIGERFLKLLDHLCGTRVIDLLWHLPVSITDRTYDVPLRQAQTGRLWTGIVRVVEHQAPAIRKKPYRIAVENDQQTLILNFFKYYPQTLQKNLPVDALKVVSGRLEMFNGVFHMNHPDYIADASEFEAIRGIEAVRPLCAGVSGKMLGKIISGALKQIPDLPEWQDRLFCQREEFPSFKQALIMAQTPHSVRDLSPETSFRRRLAYDELLANQLTLAIARARIKKTAGRSFSSQGLFKQKLLAGLDFELTTAQKRVLEEIEADQKSPYKMLRLLQGDVGCGKTIVAFLTMLNAVECGAQATIMAPTEILAKQHLESMSVWGNLTGVSVELLTGKIKGRKREEILERLASGQIDILIGTHALFTEGVRFKDLGCVVVDEQHRFGVNQRLELSAKGRQADVLVMTATPIPRTLVLTQYGDMDYSKIDEVPKGRKPADTRILSVDKITDVVAGLQRKLESGCQAYWVCPLIEESEKTDLATAEERFSALQKVFGQRVGMIHGKMKEKEKDEVMNRFKNGDLSLLVATTVIEVGVNVPQATVMIIEQAERFGLAQLHQLRGRIKRGFESATCLLLHGYPLSATARERLKIMKESEDGFLIAEKDLELRGGGEVLGTRQSGFEAFRLAELPAHRDLLLTAYREAEMILKTNPDFSGERGQALKCLLYLFERDDALKTYLAG